MFRMRPDAARTAQQLATPVSEPSADAAAQLFARARQAMAQGNYREALEHAQALQQPCGTDYKLSGEAALLAAMCHANVEEPAQALAWAETALRHATLARESDLQARGWVVFGSSCAALNRPVEAIQALDKAVSLVDGASTDKLTLAIVFVGIGLSYDALGMPIQALAAHRQACAAASHLANLDSLRLRARANLIYAAVVAYDLVKPIDDAGAQALLTEGMAHLHPLAQEAARLNTQHAASAHRHASARLLHRAGRLAEARQMMQELVRTETEVGDGLKFELRLDLALIERDAGAIDEARRIAAEARACAGSSSAASAHLKTIRRLSRLAELEGDLAHALALHKRYHARVIRNEHAAVEARLAEFEAKVSIQTLRMEVADLRQRNAGLSDTFRQLEDLAHIDAVTGALNRRALEATFAAIERSEMVLGMVDLDHFKRVNDEFSHVVGDRVLAQVVRLMRETLREHDRLGRYGGEEFVVLMPTGRQANLGALAERLRVRVEAYNWSTLANGLRVTLSAGFVAVRPDESFEDAVSRADALLYLAKSQGRNRVAVEPETRPH
jgi:diguanylate cyclase (GGDEF)-like protein